MMDEDAVVYLHPNGRDYVANFTELGWLRWPAERDGWTERHGCSAELAASCAELEPRLAALALRLSGAWPGVTP
jgi:hypothetical protein